MIPFSHTLLDNADPQVLQKLLSGPHAASPEEAEGLIRCPENETLLSSHSPVRPVR